MSMQSINLIQLGALHTALDVHNLFRQLGYPVETPDAFIGDDLDALELNPADRANVARAYIVARLNTHTVYLYEVNDLRTARLRSLAWNALQRGTGLLIVATPAERGAYRQILFVDPRFAGKPIKSSVRVTKLKVITAEPTRHDLDTLNAIHAHRRSAQQVYDEQGKAFNVTTVTKRFYDEYRGHYERAKAAIAKANPGVREFYDADKLHAFTQRLLGRLMFLYFLQRKGWLGERARFLTERYTALQRQHAGETGDGDTYRYYAEVLEPLFFQTLNTKRPGDITKWEGIRIPYLNGGLFDEARDPSGPILIPDALFDPNDVTGLLGFFNRYNFTIADDTPLEQDVAVDPEMLGKVFENLLEERDRGQSGSFYTPRPIVAYMCQEALAGYLEESAKDANGISISRETTRALFDPDADARLTPDEAVRMNAALDTLTVLDPAVGSGSFLIGMMTEIVRLRLAAYAALHPDASEPTAQTVSDWKEAIIRDTLYGVDIKPEAIEIAQLRLWLALVVEQSLDQARPLPNLDYKLMAGNSLIETIDGEPVLTDSATAMLGTSVQPEQATLGLFETDHERRKLDEMRRDYFSATPEERKRLKPDILHQERRIVATALREKAETQEQIINRLGKLAGEGRGTLKPADTRKLNAAAAKLTRLTNLQEAMGKPDYVSPFFLYRLHFSEVFERKGGFDIVVANPPYVDSETMTRNMPELRSEYSRIYDSAEGNWDLFVVFVERGLGLLKNRGDFAYIIPNKFVAAPYSESIREIIRKDYRVLEIRDFSNVRVFSEAAVYPVVITLKKTAFRSSVMMRVMETEDLEAAQVLVEPNLFYSDVYWDRYLASTPEATLLVTRLLSFERLEATSNVFGAATVSEAYKIKEILREEGDVGNEPFKRLINTGTIDRFLSLYGKQRTRYIKSSYLHPVVLNSDLAMVSKTRLEQAERPKIIVGGMTRFLECYLDVDGSYVAGKSTIVVSDQKERLPYLLGILNSNVATFFYVTYFNSMSLAGGYYRVGPPQISQIPIPNPPTDLRDRIAVAARACLDAAKDHPERLPALEGELNRLVYQAYGLDADDIAVIEGAVGNKNSTDSVHVSDESVEE